MWKSDISQLERIIKYFDVQMISKKCKIKLKNKIIE